MKKRVLLVEDDPALARALSDSLSYEGFDVDWARSGPQALDRARSAPPHVVLLDICIPGCDGFEVCRALQAGGARLPVIMLTVRQLKEDKVRALQLGADDYVTKPFSFEELLARIHALLRRSYPTTRHLVLGDVRIDFGQMHAEKSGAALPFTSREFAVLQYLAERAGKVVTREELLLNVWGQRGALLTRTVDNFIARLRRKVERDPHRPEFIRTAHGDGYSLLITSGNDDVKEV